MTDDLQPVIDALTRAQQAPDPAHMLYGPATTGGHVIKAMAQQTSATNAAVLAWLEYVVARERRPTIVQESHKPPPSRDERIHKTGNGKSEGA